MFRVRIGLDRPWLPMVVIAAALVLFTAYLVQFRLSLGSWVLPEGALGVIALLAVLAKLSRHGGQVLYALKHTCREHGIHMVGEASPPREADHHRPVMG
jgi:hypothetical protein